MTGTNAVPSSTTSLMRGGVDRPSGSNGSGNTANRQSARHSPSGQDPDDVATTCSSSRLPLGQTLSRLRNASQRYLEMFTIVTAEDDYKQLSRLGNPSMLRDLEDLRQKVSDLHQSLPEETQFPSLTNRTIGALAQMDLVEAEARLTSMEGLVDICLGEHDKTEELAWTYQTFCALHFLEKVMPDLDTPWGEGLSTSWHGGWNEALQKLPQPPEVMYVLNDLLSLVASKNMTGVDLKRTLTDSTDVKLTQARAWSKTLTDPLPVSLDDWHAPAALSLVISGWGLKKKHEVVSEDLDDAADDTRQSESAASKPQLGESADEGRLTDAAKQERMRRESERKTVGQWWERVIQSTPMERLKWAENW